MPLANALLAVDQLGNPESKYPLVLVLCAECSLVQITEDVRPEELFLEYLYFSSYSDTMLQHAKEEVAELVASRGLDKVSLAIEIGSNDGYLLQFFLKHQVPVLGIEPARNIAKSAEAKGIPTLSEFFNIVLSQKLAKQGKDADVIVANNVLAHASDINDFVEAIGTLLKIDGVAVIEVPYVKPLIDRSEFDTIYHEHRCYFSLTALESLFSRHQLTISDVKMLTIHGGSLRIYANHAQHGEPNERVKSLLKEEQRWRVSSEKPYLELARSAERTKTALPSRLRELKGASHRIAAYGAAAKGTVLLNYCGIASDLLDFVADRNPVKQGRYLPGVHLLISPPSRILEDRPDYLLILAWNLAEEIMQQQNEFRSRGGKFIIPTPEVRIV